jgi:hypothetical protein
MVLLLLGVAAFYPQREARPRTYGALLGLLALTEIWAWPTVAVLGVAFAWETLVARHRDATYRIGPPLRGMVVLASAIAILPVMLRPAADANPVVTESRFFPEAFMMLVQQGFMPLRSLGYLFGDPNFNPIGARRYWAHALLLGPGIAAIGLSLWVLRRKWVALCSLVGSLACVFYISTFKYQGMFWHAAQIPLLVITALWIGSEKTQGALLPATPSGRALGNVFTATFAYSAMVGLLLMTYDVFRPYSGGTDAGQFVASQTEQNDLVIGVGCHPLVAPAGYLAQRRFWHSGISAFRTYMLYNEFARCDTTPTEVMLERAATAFPWARGVFVISERPISAPQRWGLRPERQSPGVWESFWIYRSTAFTSSAHFALHSQQ